MAVNSEKGKNEFLGYIIIAFIFILIAGIVLAGQFFKSEGKLELSFKNGQILSTVFAVYDSDKNILGTSVLFFHPFTNKVAIVSILPKTYISFGKNGFFTIEEAFNKKINNDDFKEGVAKLLGTKIDYYVYIKKSDFIELIDLLGGVEIYTNEIKNLEQNVHIPAGLNLFDGDKIDEYLTYVANDKIESGYDQLKRIQNFIRGVLKLKEDFLESYNEDIIKNYFYKNITTNIGVGDYILIYNEIKKRFKDKITDFSRGSENVLVYCDKKTTEGYDYILQPKKSGNWVKGEMTEAINNLSKKIIDDTDKKIVIEILNGTDIVGFALRAKKYLETFGIDVLEVGNADNENYQNTIVIIRTTEQKATKFADLIKCKKIIKSDENNGKKVDLTLILGKDFDGQVVK
ncbi:MAG TPA: LCP family protein [Spirochaetota bacterium]|nr:LCP family protein [Spirochaetota bacterium]